MPTTTGDKFSDACTFYSVSIVLNIAVTWAFLLHTNQASKKPRCVATLAPTFPWESVECTKEAKEGAKEAEVADAVTGEQAKQFLMTQTWARPGCACPDCE